MFQRINAYKLGDFIVCTIVLFAFSGCNIDKKNWSKENYQKAKQAHEIKKVSESDILSKAFQIGRQVADSSQNALVRQLQGAVINGGVPYAIRFCNVKAVPIIDSLSQIYDLVIKRVSDKNRNPLNKPDSIEAILLGAYAYNDENNAPFEDNIQKIDDDQLLFTRAILVSSPLCLNCHGNVGTDVNEDTQKTLNGLYPNDKAINYKIGDLRGMWSITIPVKTVVNSLD